MKIDKTSINNYLSLIEDETLSEHDKKYHHGQYEEGQKCGKRETQKEEDNGDKLLNTSNEYELKHRKWLKNAKEEELSKYMEFYDDGKHEKEMRWWNEEVEKRQNGGLEKYLEQLGEKA